MMQVVSVVDARRYEEYAREHLKAAVDGLDSGVEVLGEVQAALMALHVCYGSTETIALTAADVAEDVDRSEPTCICPPELVARGGFRSGCPVHHR
jgi:rhodanese-related sulfurtransferase